jgi:hypothetical protein
VQPDRNKSSRKMEAAHSSETSENFDEATRSNIHESRCLRNKARSWPVARGPWPIRYRSTCLLTYLQTIPDYRFLNIKFLSESNLSFLSNKKLNINVSCTSCRTLVPCEKRCHLWWIHKLSHSVTWIFDLHTNLNLGTDLFRLETVREYHVLRTSHDTSLLFCLGK